MSKVTEFGVGEVCVSTIHITASALGDEAYSGPIHVGYYRHGQGEVWIECEGQRVAVPAHHFNALLRQLKRAHAIAKEAEQ